MSYQYAAIIGQDGYVSRFAPYNDNFPLACAETEVALSITAQESAAMSAVTNGRYRYVDGEFVLELDTENVTIMTVRVTTERNELLKQSDWTQLPDVPLVTKEAWATYRQALRDITDQPGFPLSVVWPTAPGN